MTVTLLNGSSTDPDAVSMALDIATRDKERPIKVLCTDPPYGANFVSRRAETPGGKKFVQAIGNDGTLEDAFATFVDMYGACADYLDPNECEMYVFTRWDIVGDWISFLTMLLEPHGWTYKMMLVWDKGIPGMGDIDSNWGCGHELILYLKRGRRPIPFRRSSIIAVDKVPAQHIIHPTEKPQELLERLLVMSANPGDLIYEPFAGSGSTLAAAMALEMDAVGFEMDPTFYARTNERLAASVDLFTS